MPLEEIDGLQLGDPVVARSEDARVEVGPELLGRVIDGFGKPHRRRPAHRSAATAYDSVRHARQPAGARAHHASRWSPASAPSTACCPAARASASASSAAAASARARCSAPCRATIRPTSRVIALIGERNREVRGFLENELGPEGTQALGGGGGHLRPARRRCACAPASSRWPWPSTSATRAPTCCW